jgi:hypothetical protein
MAGTTFATLKPTAGAQAGTYEWLWDIAVVPTGATSPTWVNVPDITGLTPTPAPKFKDGTTYANKGQTSQQKTGDDFTLAVSVKGVKDTTGEFQPELLILFAAADAVGAANILLYRYYHATSPSLAWSGSAAVQWSRDNTGNDDLEMFGFTLTGQGDRKKITNPGLSS